MCTSPHARTHAGFPGAACSSGAPDACRERRRRAPVRDSSAAGAALVLRPELARPPLSRSSWSRAGDGSPAARISMIVIPRGKITRASAATSFMPPTLGSKNRCTDLRKPVPRRVQMTAGTRPPNDDRPQRTFCLGRRSPQPARGALAYRPFPLRGFAQRLLRILRAEWRSARAWRRTGPDDAGMWMVRAV